MLSFKTSEFFPVLEQYNEDIWPLQVVAFILAFSAIFFSVKRTSWATRVILATLAFFWLWNGMVFCFLYWAPGYAYAYFFTALCAVQGILFVKEAIKPSFCFEYKKGVSGIAAFLFLAYAVVGYQLLGLAIDHVYPRYFPVGLVPCPTTIFTLGLFLLANQNFPKYLLYLPIVGAISGLIAVSGGIYEDVGLLIAGIVTPLIILTEKWTNQKTQHF